MQMQITAVHSPQKSSIDQAPYVNIREDGLVTAFGDEPSGEVGSQPVEDDEAGDSVNSMMQQETNATTQFDPTPQPDFDAVTVPVKRCLNQLSQRSKISIWVLAYIAVITTWPILGSVSPMFFKKKLRNFFSLKR